MSQLISKHALATVYLLYTDMAYEIEDEIDWSDGPLDNASLRDGQPSTGPGYIKPIVEDATNSHGLFVPEAEDHYELPVGSPLPFSKHIGVD